MGSIVVTERAIRYDRTVSVHAQCITLATHCEYSIPALTPFHYKCDDDATV